jgi:hypothetical protein
VSYYGQNDPETDYRPIGTVPARPGDTATVIHVECNPDIRRPVLEDVHSEWIAWRGASTTPPGYDPVIAASYDLAQDEVVPVERPDGRQEDFGNRVYEL